MASSTERTRRYRERLKQAGATAAAPKQPCLACGKLVATCRIEPDSPRGRSKVGDVLCAKCWRRTPDGKAEERARNRRRAKAKQQQQKA